MPTSAVERVGPNRCPMTWWDPRIAVTGVAATGRLRDQPDTTSDGVGTGCCGAGGWRERPRHRSLVRSRCAMTRPSDLHQIVSIRHCIQPGSRGGRREAYISAQHTATCQEARVPRSHEHPWRTGRDQEPPGQGPRPSLGLIDRIRERHAFARLGREGTRIRRSALWCSWCPDPDSTTTSVAFAITRAYGPAVTRNRLRRRLRSILRELDRANPLPPILLLVGPRSSTIELTFDQLRHELTALIEQVRSQQPGNPQLPLSPPMSGDPQMPAHPHMVDECSR